MTKKKSCFQQSEKRKAQRLELALKIEYKLKGDKRTIKTICKDISGKGIRISTYQPLKLGDAVDMIIHSKDAGSQPFTAQCKVIWVKKTGSDIFDMGLSFVKIDNRDEFIKHFCEKMVNLFLIDDNVYE